MRYQGSLNLFKESIHIALSCYSLKNIGMLLQRMYTHGWDRQELNASFAGGDSSAKICHTFQSLLVCAHTIAKELSMCTNLARAMLDDIALWYDQIQEKLSAELVEQLTHISWPQPRPMETEELDETWTTTFSLLLDVQTAFNAATLALQTALNMESVSEADLPLRAMEVLFAPLVARFTHHFMQKSDADIRATNQLDKPEWMFTYVLSIIREHREFINEYIQPLLDDHCPGRNAVVTLMETLVQQARRRILEVRDILGQQPTLLTHWITQTIAFEQGTDKHCVWVADDGSTSYCV